MLDEINPQHFNQIILTIHVDNWYELSDNWIEVTDIHCLNDLFIMRTN